MNIPTSNLGAIFAKALSQALGKAMERVAYEDEHGYMVVDLEIVYETIDEVLGVSPDDTI